MAVINLFVIISGVLFLGFLMGTVDYLVNHEENRCEMTYMFEYPQYVRIVLPIPVAQNFPRYKLYAYGEGQYTEKLRSMKFRGVPVLFIPGNGGSYKQVRSLASISLRKSFSSNTPIMFNYFTVDLNEEFSALYGAVLYEQTKFIDHCIRRILSLYVDDKKKPKSVVIIGHSMGGIVAKGLLMEPNFDPNSVSSIITLATPHKSPVLMADEHIAKYHANVSRFWANSRNSSLKHIAVVSIGGGHRDILVRSELIKSDYTDFSLLTTAIPTVWVATDHLCILWCKQLILVIVRALFDMVDPKTLQISESIEHKKMALSYHLVKRTASKRLAASFHPREAHFDQEGDWQEPLKRYFSFHQERVSRTTYMMVRLTDNTKYQMLAVEAINLNAKDWVYVCIADQMYKGVRMCEKGINLSNETKFIPSLKMKRKTILLNLAVLKRLSYTHVVIQIPPSNEPVQVHFDIHSGVSRKLVFPAPKWFSFASGELPVLEASVEGALRYEIRLQGAEHIWQAYLLHLRPSCPIQTTHHATATLTTSWSQEDVHAFVTESMVQPLRAKLQTPKPPISGKNETMKVKLILDPTCRYSVSIQSSLSDSLGQLVRFYAPMLLPYMVAVLMLTARHQMQVMQKEGYCSSIFTSLAIGGKPYYILPTVKIGSKIIGFLFSHQKERGLIPPPDSSLIQEQDIDFLLLPILAYATAFATVYVLGLASWLLVMFWGNAFHKIVTKVFSRIFRGGNTQWGEWALMSFLNFPKIVSALLIAIAVGTCGAVALLFGLIFYFLFICKIYEDLIEEMFKYPLKVIHRIRKWATEKQDSFENIEDEEKEDFFSKLYFHTTILLLWLLLTILHFPCALVWIHNFRNNAPLYPDPSLLPAIILSMCAAVLWQKNIPVMKMRNFIVLDYGIYMLSCLVLVYASLTTYRAGMFIHMTIVLITVYQTMMVEALPAIQPQTSEETVEEEYVEDEDELSQGEKLESSFDKSSDEHLEDEVKEEKSFGKDSDSAAESGAVTDNENIKEPQHNK